MARKTFAKLRRYWQNASVIYRKVVKVAAVAGVLIGLICHFLPPRYQGACDALSALCGGR